MEWIDATKRLPTQFAARLRVRRSDGTEIHAFYYQDAMAWIAQYGKKTSHWWSATHPHERIDDVTHWRQNELD